MTPSKKTVQAHTTQTIEQNELLNLQNRILEDILLGQYSFQALLDKLCIIAETLVSNSLASITMKDENDGQLQVLAAPSAPPSVLQDFSGLQPSVGVGSCANTIFTGQPTYVSNIYLDPLWRNVQPLARKYKLSACWSHPIFLNTDTALGSFALSSLETREPTDFQRNLLRVCANLVSIIWQKKEQEESLWRIAHHDALTGLPNRKLLDHQLSHALDMAQRNQTLLALMFIDLDNFKDINDSYGHDFGDRVLLHSTQILKQCVRDNDLIYRHGGDEFLLVLENLKQLEDADIIAQKILAEFLSPVEFEGQKLLVQFSIGISLYPQDGDNAQELLKNADIAMYQAKAAGKNSICYFEPHLAARILHKVTLEQQMREALRNNEFELYYQAQFAADSDQIESLEALIRWNHPERGLLLPGEFIPIAENSRLIVDISRYVMQTVCRQGVEWLARGFDIPRLAVNLSTSQLTESCADNLSRLLKKTALPVEKFELEITETLLMNRGEKGINELNKLSGLGVSLALDDFGTGYSSLSQLKRLPIDKLKIDRSFVQNLESDPNDRSLIKTIIAMGKNLSMKIVAKGVETPGQQDFLLEQGCDSIQGFLRHRPAPVSEIEKLLKYSR